MLQQNELITLLNVFLKNNEFEEFKSLIKSELRFRGVSELSKKTSLRRETFYSSLKPEKKPAFRTIKEILSSMDLEIIVKKKE